MYLKHQQSVSLFCPIVEVGSQNCSQQIGKLTGNVLSLHRQRQLLAWGRKQIEICPQAREERFGFEQARENCPGKRVLSSGKRRGFPSGKQEAVVLARGVFLGQERGDTLLGEDMHFCPDQPSLAAHVLCHRAKRTISRHIDIVTTGKYRTD